MRFLIPTVALALLGACARDAAPEPAARDAVEAVDLAPAPAAVAPPPGPVGASVPLPPGAPRVQPGPTELLEVLTAKGPVRFRVEIADDEAERQQGLMWRSSMPTNHGMLFLFPAETEQAFWMRNTYIPLDILYLRSDGRVHSIARSTTPLSEAPIPSGGPVSAVLEINGGLAETLGIAPGDQVRHPAFGSAGQTGG